MAVVDVSPEIVVFERVNVARRELLSNDVTHRIVGISRRPSGSIDVTYDPAPRVVLDDLERLVWVLVKNRSVILIVANDELVAFGKKFDVPHEWLGSVHDRSRAVGCHETSRISSFVDDGHGWRTGRSTTVDDIAG